MTKKAIIYGIAVALGFAAVLVLSPLILTLVSFLPLDWEKLNAVGQSYTAVAALISAAALGGVVMAARLQARQVDIAQQQSMRDMQFRLNEMALADPALGWAVNGNQFDSRNELNTWRTQTYAAMWIRYLQYGFELGTVPEQFVRVFLEKELFANAPGRDLWRNWADSLHFAFESEQTERFRHILQEEYDRSLLNRTTSGQ